MKKKVRFAAAKNRAVIVFAAVAFASVCLPLAVASFQQGGHHIAGFFAFAAACCILIYLMLRRYYEFKEDFLLYVFGPVTTKCFYARITKVCAAGRAWPHAALRYAVYEMGELKFIICPQDGKGFISMLRKKCGGARFYV